MRLLFGRTSVLIVRSIVTLKKKMMNKLESGFYWVKILSGHDEKWTVGEYLGYDCGWMFLGIKEGYEDDVDFEVGERLIEPKDLDI